MDLSDFKYIRDYEKAILMNIGYKGCQKAFYYEAEDKHDILFLIHRYYEEKIIDNFETSLDTHLEDGSEMDCANLSRKGMHYLRYTLRVADKVYDDWLEERQQLYFEKYPSRRWVLYLRDHHEELRDLLLTGGGRIRIIYDDKSEEWIRKNDPRYPYADMNRVLMNLKMYYEYMLYIEVVDANGNVWFEGKDQERYYRVNDSFERKG